MTGGCSCITGSSTASRRSSGTWCWRSTIRYSSAGRSRSLFFSHDARTVKEQYPERHALQQLSDDAGSWSRSPSATCPAPGSSFPRQATGCSGKGGDQLLPFTPRPPSKAQLWPTSLSATQPSPTSGDGTCSILCRAAPGSQPCRDLWFTGHSRADTSVPARSALYPEGTARHRACRQEADPASRAVSSPLRRRSGGNGIA